MQFGSAKVEGTIVNLHANSPTFRAAKLKGFTVKQKTLKKPKSTSQKFSRKCVSLCTISTISGVGQIPLNLEWGC